MIRLAMLLCAVSLLAGCRAEDVTCNVCVRRCAPFDVVSCEPIYGWNTGHPLPPSCTCAPRRTP